MMTLSQLIVPAQIGFILWRLYVSFGGREAGEASATAFLGIAVIIVVMPALGLILKKTFVAKKKQLAFSDKRVRPQLHRHFMFCCLFLFHIDRLVSSLFLLYTYNIIYLDAGDN